MEKALTFKDLALRAAIFGAIFGLFFGLSEAHETYALAAFVFAIYFFLYRWKNSLLGLPVFIAVAAVFIAIFLIIGG